MVYGELGSTGLVVSEIGLGCEGFIGKDDDFTAALFTRAIERGINCMDLYSSNPELRKAIGKVLRGKREKFILQAHICTTWQDGQYKRTRDMALVRESFDDMLNKLETDYIDIGMIHYVDSVEEWRQLVNGPVMEYVKELKASGKIRHTGLSSHNPDVALEAVESGLIEVLMFSVNPCYDLQPGDEELEKLWAPESYTNPLVNMNPERQKLYETCLRLGVGITVMKAFGGGDLLSSDSPAGRALTVNQCIYYALTRPGVASVFVGVHSLEQLEASLAYEEASQSEKDYAHALSEFKNISWRGHCMYCGHCAPCPSGINIAAVTRFLNLAKNQKETPETVREHYGALSKTAEKCVKCGACEGRCPFQVPIRENMDMAKKIFGK